jgi:hypothetical protein
MNLNFLSRKLGPAVGLAGVVALLATSGGATAAPQGSASAACQKSTNFEAIIDDSGSMSGSDPLKFRTKLLDTFANIGANSGKILGGVEFGTTANPLFSPAPMPGVVPAMNASFVQVDADNGGTDYDAGFAAGNAQNPNANARIFLSDGLASEPTQHLSPRVKTFVVGLGLSNNQQAIDLLTKIANDTGGPPPFLIEEASQLQPVAGAITAAANCKRVLQFIDTFNERGDTFGHAFKANGKAADILTTWANIGTLLDLVKVKAVFRGRPLAASAELAQTARVRAKKKKGETFTTVRIKGLKKGAKVKFKVKAKALAGTTVGTTQVIR